MMTSALPTSSPRTSWQGAGQILRFNWPMYAAATIAIIVALAAVAILRPAASIGATIVAAAALIVWWSIGSLLASHWVYDRSGLFELAWLKQITPRAARWATVHAGLDEFSSPLRREYGEPIAVLNIYDPERMTEPSITRAQGALGLDSRAVRATYDHLPLADGALDAAFVFFAAHELRTHEHRASLFREIRRTLAPDGVAVVVEHLRDSWSLAAFGPGFLHFFSRHMDQVVLGRGSPH